MANRGRRERAINALLVGKNVTQSAAAAGISRQTLSKWLHEDDALVAELNLRRQELWQAYRQRLLHLTDNALAALSQLLTTSRSERIRLTAATRIIDWAQTMQPSEPTTAADVEHARLWKQWAHITNAPPPGFDAIS